MGIAISLRKTLPKQNVRLPWSRWVWLQLQALATVLPSLLRLWLVGLSSSCIVLLSLVKPCAAPLAKLFQNILLESPGSLIFRSTYHEIYFVQRGIFALLALTVFWMRQALLSSAGLRLALHCRALFKTLTSFHPLPFVAFLFLA